MDTDFRERKLPPQNIEAEQAVLGGMVIDPQTISEVMTILVSEDFYREAHRRIFEVIVFLHEHGVPIDLITITDELRNRGQSDLAGGPSYVASLIDATTSTANIKSHAEVVKEKANKRRAIMVGTEIVTRAYEGVGDTTETVGLLSEAASEMGRGLAKGGAGAKELTPDRIIQYYAGCVDTAFESLDRAIGGFFPGEFITVGAWPGMGKTAFALACLKKTAVEKKRRCAFFHAQISEQELRARLLSLLSGVDFNVLRRGTRKEELMKKLWAAHKRIDSAPISWFVREKKLDAVWVMAEIRKILAEYGDIGLVFIENLQQMFWPQTERFKAVRGEAERKKAEFDLIVESLKEFAIKIKVPVALSCQLTKASATEFRPPTIGDFRDTGKIAEIAHKVIMPFRPEYQEKRKSLRKKAEDAVFRVQRGGIPVDLPMKFINSTLSWREA